MRKLCTDFSLFRSKRMRGFTLTELSIVIGITGLVLGAIWVAASGVSQSNKVQLAVKEAATILQNYRTLFATHPVDTGNDVKDDTWTDITCLGVNSGFFPNEMVASLPPCVANTQGYPLSPWGGWLYVWGVQFTQSIVLQYNNLPQAACIQMAAQLFNSPDIIWQQVAGNGAPAAGAWLPPLGNGVPLTMAQITGACANNNNNVLQVGYKAR